MRNPMMECYSCAHRKDVPGSAHSSCINPSLKVAKDGDKYGKDQGWFNYPSSFDPVWKGDDLCEHFKEKEGSV